MKRRFLLIALSALCAAGTLVSCNDVGGDVQTDVTSEVVFRNTKAVFPASGGTKALFSEVSLEGVTGVVSSAAWCSAATVGNTLSVTVEPNPGTDDREASLDVTLDGVKIGLSVLQAGLAKADLSVSYDGGAELDSEGGTAYITVNSNAEWVAETDASWLSLSPDMDGGKLTVSAEVNEGGDRSATVTITSRDKQENVTVSQMSRERNPYYSLVGNWRLEAEQWYYAPSTQAVLLYAKDGPSDDIVVTLAANHYGRDYSSVGLLRVNSRYPFLYDAVNDVINLPCGWYIGSTSGMYSCFLIRADITVSSKKYYPKYDELKGVISEDRKTITFSEWAIDNPSTVHGLGIVYDDDNGNLLSLYGTYFPVGEIKLVRID